MGFNKREFKGIKLTLKGYVKQIDRSTFMVRSENDPNKYYTVSWDKDKWVCGCEDYARRGKKCKHIFAVCYFLTIRDIATGVKEVECSSEICCPRCGGKDVIRRGYDYQKNGVVQRFYCKFCNYRFNYRGGFEGLKGNATTVVLSLDLYFRGLSLRQISEHLLSVYGLHVSHATVRNWIMRYVKLISKYLNNLPVKCGERWHCDDTVVRVNGRHVLIWSLLDSETRLLIAHHISENRNSEEAYKLLSKAIENSEKKPEEIVSDGFDGYAKAVKRKFSEELKHPVIHLQGNVSSAINNKMERFWRDIKKRYKTIYGFRNIETAKTFMDGYRIFHNQIKKHRSLGNKTPAETSQAELPNTWIKLIQEASKN